MASEPQSGSQPREDAGQPSDLASSNPIVRAVERAVDRLETSRSYIERDLEQGRADMRDVRDRLARLETKVADLPSKVWIGGVVATGIGATTALLTLIFKLITGH